jgi:zinc transport system substrate-binding protein
VRVKRWSIIFLLLALVVSMTGCGQANDKQAGQLQVVTTFYPLYALTKAIGGDHVHVSSLIATGVEPHDWTPKAKDMMRIADADVFVYNGAGFEGWVEAFIQNEADSKLRVIEASKQADLIATGKKTVDPHVWTSPKQAKQMAAAIYQGLIKADPKHQVAYANNLSAVQKKLDAIDEEYVNVVAQASNRNMVVSHDAFAYLARDYGIQVKSIMGLSPETEPTAKELKQISAFVKANRVSVILVEALASPKLARTLAHDLGVKTIAFNPLEGLTKQQQQAGEDYFSLLQSNATTLQKALR